MKALIYLRMGRQVFEQTDLDRLDAIRACLDAVGYRVEEAWPVWAPAAVESPDDARWWEAKKGLGLGRWDAVAFWDPMLNEPRLLLRRHLE
jgi:hypothetical protein